MKSRKLIIIIAVGTLLLMSLACSLPAQFTSQSITSTASTPDITLTAIVAQLYVQATMTAAATTTQIDTPVIPTDTPEPTATVQTTTAVPPTPTETITETPVPTISYEGPNERSGPSVEAVYMDEEPTIDGVLDEEEWEMDRYDADEVVYGKSQWKNENDLSANFMLGWDEDYLYVAAKVKDENYVQRSSGKNLYKGDCIEILLDTSVAKDFYLEKLSKDDFQLGISPGSPKPGKDSEAYLWYPEEHAGGKSGVKIGSTLLDGGYRIEAKIPWDVFRTDPEDGAHYGFAFSVSDNDKSGESIQQSIISITSKRDMLDPTTWGDLVLTGGPSDDDHPGRGKRMEAEYLDDAPSIDGNLDDWSIDAVDVDHVTYGHEKWGGKDDLTGSVMVGWDEEYLFLGVTVEDDSYQQRTKGENLYLGDSLEVLFDRNIEDDYWDHNLNNDDYQLGISAGKNDVNNDPEAFLWNPRSKAGGKSKVKIAAKSASDGYVVEVAIPWKVLGGSLKEGQHCGFIFSISDNDQSNKNVQQTMVSTIDRRIWTDPTTWGELILID